MDKFNESKIFQEKGKTENDKNGSGDVRFINGSNVNKVKSMISDNKGITQEYVKGLVKEIKGSKFLIFGDEMTQEDLEKVSKKDITISQEIMNGNNENEDNLKYLFTGVLEKLLSMDVFDLSLLRIPSITDKQAELMSKSTFDIWLHGLRSISDIQAKWLSQHKDGVVSMGLTEISDEQAEWFSKSKGPLFLNKLIPSNHQIELLASNKNSLSLDGIKLLSDDTAKSLSKHRGGLSLDGLTFLSPAQAEWLSMCQRLSLNGLSSILDETMEKLMRQSKTGKTVSRITLDGLFSISDKQAQFIANFKGDLGLRKIANISEEQARSISQHQGGLDLGGLSFIEEDIIILLGWHKGRISLTGLKTITDEQAEAFSKAKCLFSIPRIVLTEKQAQILAKSKVMPHLGEKEKEKVNKYIK